MSVLYFCIKLSKFHVVSLTARQKLILFLEPTVETVAIFTLAFGFCKHLQTLEKRL